MFWRTLGTSGTANDGIRWLLPYTLDDMADDAVALLDALNLPSAHLAGASMGEMISQLIEGMAHDFPEQLMPIFADTIMGLVDNKR